MSLHKKDKAVKAEFFKQLYRTDKNKFNELLVNDLASRGVECRVCDKPVAIIIREKHGNYNYCDRCYKASAKCDYCLRRRKAEYQYVDDFGKGRCVDGCNEPDDMFRKQVMGQDAYCVMCGSTKEKDGKSRCKDCLSQIRLQQIKESEREKDLAIFQAYCDAEPDDDDLHHDDGYDTYDGIW
jgi:hypothetical protein